jgi:hypothetical protein
MKLPLLASAILLLAPAALSAAEPSPVGTWEITLSGAEQGLAFATFEEDKDLTGYGLSDDAPGIFTLAGTWDIDEKGNLTGSYLRVADGNSVTGTLTARLTGRRITGSIAAENGNFSFKARPQGNTRNLTGEWEGLATQDGTSVPQSYTIVPTALPGVFDITGSGLSLVAGEFGITGTAVIHSTGKVQLLAISDFEAEANVHTSLAGTVKLARARNLLRGSDSTGSPIQVRLTR